MMQNLEELVVPVILELDLVRYSTRDSWVVGKECFHLLVVACQNKDYLASQILNLRKKVVENSIPPVAIPGYQLISFIDKKHASVIVQDYFNVFLAPRNTAVGKG